MALFLRHSSGIDHPGLENLPGKIKSRVRPKQDGNPLFIGFLNRLLIRLLPATQHDCRHLAQDSDGDYILVRLNGQPDTTDRGVAHDIA